MKKFKKIIQKLHLWLGMVSGVIIFIIAITGCVYVFSEDITSILYKDRQTVNIPKNQQKIPVSTLLNTAKKAIGNTYPCKRILIPTEPGKSVRFVFEEINKEGFLYPNYMQFYKTVYVNPYTGKVALVENTKWEFFNVIFWIHITLFLGYNAVSHTIIVGSLWIFVFMLISGLVLWWPTKKQRKQSFRFRWKRTTRWRRKNYDLHNILGFYVLAIAITMSLTGLLYASESFNTSVKWLANGGKLITESNLPVSKATKASVSPLDDALEQTKKLAATSEYFLIKLPRNSEAPLVIRSYINKTLNYNRVVYYYDQTTAELKFTEFFSTKNNGDKVQALNYDIHVGTIGGLPTQLLWFFTSLIIASLPITGFLIWYGKRKRKNNV